MNKDTTIYINIINLNKIEDAADKTKMKRNQIIVALLKFAIKDNVKLQNNRRSVEYQKSNPDSIWKTIHVSLPGDLAVFCLDMRRFYCKSVSYILAYSVSRFMQKLINRLLGLESEDDNADNYQLDITNFSRTELKNGIIWTRHWKSPPKHNNPK